MSIEQKMIELGWKETGDTFNRRIFSHPDFKINLVIRNHDDRCYICKWPAIDYNREICDVTDLLIIQGFCMAGYDPWEEFKKPKR